MFKSLATKLFPERVNRVLYKIAKNNDFLLLNNVKLDILEQKISCSHLLISDKFIYCILDRYFENQVDGAIKDKKWIVRNKDGSDKRIVNNPIMLNRYYVYNLNMYFTKGAVDEFLVIPVTVINNSTKIPECVYEDANAENEIVQIKNLKNFIMDFEQTQKVGKLNPDDLELLVEFIKTFNGGMKRR